MFFHFQSELDLITINKCYSFIAEMAPVTLLFVILSNEFECFATQISTRINLLNFIKTNIVLTSSWQHQTYDVFPWFSGIKLKSICQKVQIIFIMYLMLMKQQIHHTDTYYKGKKITRNKNIPPISKELLYPRLNSSLMNNFNMKIILKTKKMAVNLTSKCKFLGSCLFEKIMLVQI